MIERLGITTEMKAKTTLVPGSEYADVLAKRWRERGRRRTLLRAGIAVALSFDTSRALTREQQLTDQQALELMLRLTCDCAGDPHERTNNAARVKR